MSRRAKEEFQRSYAVSDPRSHPKGYTEYKVTAKIVVWKRYSDFKKLHADLAYTHRNLFRRMEDFPAFPRAQVFGRFDPEVIEERRKAAEDMLHFTIHIPALNNSPQLKEFFRGGEGQSCPRHWESPSLPLPLIPVPAAGVEQGEEALGLVQDDRLLEPKLEAASKGGVSETQMKNQVEHLPIHSFPSDPASTATSLSHGEGLASLEAPGTKPEVLLSADMTQKPKVESASLDPGRYLPQATERIRQAVLCEASRDFQGAFHGYRSGVDLLLQGLQARREAVKKKTAEYLQRAEEIFQQHLKHLEL
ncbi:putative Sorting nexin-15 protein [Naja naja]|nr:putative Sorting nexin-15 protein [Naja naja]